jgi:O-antigen/teichoic acid export membrane protein/2-polyprenyl-3-methyl-5-hydroxy-6-metoxy-1,4-benzoquinol methylase
MLPSDTALHHSEHLTVEENVWGYRKRLHFMRRAITDFFADQEIGSIRVLDVGCGNGSKVAIPLALSGVQVTGVDPHPPSIEHATQLSHNCPTARFVCGMVGEVAAGRMYDVLVLSEVLEHVPDPTQLLREGLAHLAKNGLVIVTVPNGYGEFEIDSWIFRWLRLQKVVNRVKGSRRLEGLVAKVRGRRIEKMLSTDDQECGHVQFFTLSRLRELFAVNSLSVVRQAPGSFLCGPLVAHTLGRWKRFAQWNARITDRMPLQLASGWYFALRRNGATSASPGDDRQRFEAATGTSSESSVISTQPASFAVSVAATFATRIVLLCIALAVTVIVSRILGPQGRGLYAVAVAVGAVGVQIGNLGIHASNTYFVARDRSLLPLLIGNALTIGFLFGGLGAALGWVLFVRWPSLAPVHGGLLLLALLSVPFGLAYLLLQNLLLGILEVKLYNVIELSTKFLGLALLLLFVALHKSSVENLFLTGPIAIVSGLAWVSVYLLRSARQTPGVSWPLFKSNLSVGMRAYWSAIFGFLVLRADLLMVKYMLGASQAGYYSIAAVMADTVLLLPAAIASILFPKLSGMHDEARKWRFASHTTLLTAAAMFPLIFLSIVLARPVVHLFFGAAFLPAVPAFIWLMPGIFFLSIETVIVQFLNSVGFPKVVVVSWALCCCANIGLNLWAIPAYGIMGASVVSSICYTLISVLVGLIWLRGNYRKSNMLDEKPVVCA